MLSAQYERAPVSASPPQKHELCRLHRAERVHKRLVENRTLPVYCGTPWWAWTAEAKDCVSLSSFGTFSSSATAVSKKPVPLTPGKEDGRPSPLMYSSLGFSSTFRLFRP